MSGLVAFGKAGADGAPIQAADSDQSLLSRDVQKQRCSKAPLTALMNSCSFVAGDWKLDYIWMMFFNYTYRPAGSEDPMFESWSEGDACFPAFDNSGDCIAGILSQSRPGDILLFNHGLYYTLPKAYGTAPGARARSLAYHAASLAPFANSVARAWKGRPEDVFRARTTGVLPSHTEASYVNADISVTNAAADAAFAGTGWSTIDMHSIAAAYPALYSDPVHHTHELAVVLWQLLLSSLCGDPDML